GGFVGIFNHRVRRIVYRRVTDKLSLEQQERYRMKKGKLWRETITTVDNKANLASKISFEYEYDPQDPTKVSGFFTRNILNGVFKRPESDESSPPTRLSIKNAENEECARVQVHYLDSKRAKLVIQYKGIPRPNNSGFVPEPVNGAANEAEPLTFSKTVDINSSDPNDPQMRRQIFNAASKGI